MKNWKMLTLLTPAQILSSAYDWEQSVDDGKTWASYKSKTSMSGCLYRFKEKDGVEPSIYYPYESVDEIFGFFGPYRFLSNFHICENEFRVYDRIWNTSEHAYMWAKTFPDHNQGTYETVAAMTPREVKKWGSQVELRKDWDHVRVAVMEEAIFQKFKNNPDLVKLLLSTGTKTLLEANWWNDRFWGVCHKTRRGKSVLGDILMEVRNHFRMEELFGC